MPCDVNTPLAALRAEVEGGLLYEESPPLVNCPKPNQGIKYYVVLYVEGLGLLVCEVRG